MDLMTFGKIIIIAIVAEAVWETSKMTYEAGSFSFDRIGALVVSLIIAIGTGLDIMTLAQVPIQYPIIGMVLTGILISRGANVVHDIFVKIQGK